MRNKLYYVEQWFWGILAVLLMIFTVVSFITSNMMYLVVGLSILIAFVCIGMIVFGVVFERLMEILDDSEEEA